jgi:hypothetical protein
VSSPKAAALALVGWMLAVALGLVLLAKMGHTTLPPPPADDPRTALDWARSTPPLLAAGSLLRLAATVLGWYLLATAAAGAAARLLALRRAVTALDRVTLPAVRLLLHHALGVGLAAQLGLLPSAAAASEPQAAVAAMRALPDQTATMTALADAPRATASMTALAHPAPHRTTTMRALPDQTATMTASPAVPAGPAATPPANATMTAAPEAAPPATATITAAADPADPPGATWLVRPGDHLWSIAEVVVAFSGGDHRSERDVAAYWERLIEANRVNLVHPGQPDLILPGQVLDLPPRG